ncbi:hypothetical protein L596_000981 [Steinernema carpocapsae]|uniref:Apple domain-containing protein n=1 Tax=Steinernema carpocapsae TaxID=34508 RepID=A0A4U8UNY1_STECR|nr:hypothetical protein L596_000981 [Steinernema carpocapsae]
MPSMVVELQRVTLSTPSSSSSSLKQSSRTTTHSQATVVLPLMVLCYRRLFSLLVSTKIARTAVLLFLVLTPTTVRAGSGKCYFFGPGTTIDGADYRRDYDVSRRDCAEFCVQDVCCMGFEWVKGGMCTLKSRSLNGTIVAKEGAYFGLCLDFNELERDRFWDHELSGPVVASVESMERDECNSFCQAHPEKAHIYSWRSSNHRDVDEPKGRCDCIGVLHAVRLQFGSFAGFVVATV